MPLHASTTSSVVYGSTMMLPSRSAGTPVASSTASPNRDATQLQRERHLVEDDRGQRDHQHQERQRKPERPQLRPPPDERDGSREHRQHGDALQEQVRAAHTGERAARARRRAAPGPGPAPAAPPTAPSSSRRPAGEPERERRDDEAVRVVGVDRPVAHEPDEDRSRTTSRTPPRARPPQRACGPWRGPAGEPRPPQAWRRRRAARASPSSPVPRSSTVPGSGVAAFRPLAPSASRNGRLPL